MITFFCAILACQLVRGDIPSVDPVTQRSNEISFRTIWNAFLGMYQILSSENWTTILYAATSYQTQYHVAWISAAFFVLWFIVGNSEFAFLGILISRCRFEFIYCCHCTISFEVKINSI